MVMDNRFIRACLAGALLVLAGIGAPLRADDGGRPLPDGDTPSQNPLSRGADFVPGDAVLISAFPDTSSFLNGTFPIDDRGYIELPLIGKAKISHMSTSQFVDFLRQNFRDYLRFPNLYVKPMVRVSVLGGVPTPGFYYVDPEQSFWELMHQVNGTIDEDGLKEMKWKRSGDNVEDDLIPVLQRGTSLRSMGFRSGDQIWVKTPGKPGFIDKASRYISFVTAAASIVTLYFTYQRFLLVPSRGGGF